MNTDIHRHCFPPGHPDRSETDPVWKGFGAGNMISGQDGNGFCSEYTVSGAAGDVFTLGPMNFKGKAGVLRNDYLRFKRKGKRKEEGWEELMIGECRLKNLD